MMAGDCTVFDKYMLTFSANCSFTCLSYNVSGFANVNCFGDNAISRADKFDLNCTIFIFMIEFV